jgi:hypothetical protein
MKICAVSKAAHLRGYGTPEEIVQLTVIRGMTGRPKKTRALNL